MATRQRVKNQQRVEPAEIYEPPAVRFIPTQVLTELYGMTRAQARLVSQLFRGRSLSEA